METRRERVNDNPLLCPHDEEPSPLPKPPIATPFSADKAKLVLPSLPCLGSLGLASSWRRLAEANVHAMINEMGYLSGGQASVLSAPLC
jgi:hypothetical protein